MSVKSLRWFLCLLTLTSASLAAENTTVAALPPVAQSMIANAIRANTPLLNPTWTKQAILTPSDAASGHDYGFGLGQTGVAVDGDTIAVGIPFYNPGGGYYTGAVFVFVKTGSDWTTMTQTAILTASNTSTEAFLGSSVAISGNTIVLGSTNVGSPYIPAVYVYVKPTAGWTNMTETAQLTSTDGGINPHSVALSSNTIVATGTSSAYVFVEPAGGWKNMTQTAELTASASSGVAVGGVAAIDGNTIVLTGQKRNGNIYVGAVSVYVRPTGGWTNMTQTAVLTPTDTYATLIPVAISGGTIAAGDAGSSSKNVPAAGNVHIFVKPASGWRNATQTAILTASDGAPRAQLGYSVSIDGSTVVAGAPFAVINNYPNSGAVYIFNEPSSGWANITENSKLYFPDGLSGSLGWGVNIQGNTIVASAPFTQEGGVQFVGEALVFQQ